MGSRTRRSRIDRLLEEQEEEIRRLELATVALVLQAYADARRLLLEQLLAVDPGVTPYTHQRLLVLQAQVMQGIADMRDRMGQAMSEGERAAHDAAMTHTTAVIRAQEPGFIDAGNQIELQIVERLTAERGLALHQYSLDRYGADVVAAVQRRLSAGVVAGESPRELAEAIAGAAPDTPIAQAKQRAELITRMELNRAYNDAHRQSIEEHAAADPRPGDPMLKRIDEHFDNRNHPFSRAAHHVTAPPSEPFRVPVADVQAAAAVMGKRVSGIVWERQGADYVGMNLPAHFNDRGRIVPWRESWAGPREQRAAEERRRLLAAGGREKAEPAPPPMPASSPAVPNPGEPLRPSMPPDPTRKPRGKQHRKGKPLSEPSVQAERRVGQAFAAAGFDVEWLQPGQEPTPDFLVQGEGVDVYRAQGNPVTARNKVRKKVARGQASRVVVSCEVVHLDAIREELRTNPVAGLEELWFEVDGELIRE